MKLSIALCTFNGRTYLPEQLESYLAQTRLPDQLVICDDGSTDNTLRLLEAFALTAPFEVRIYRNPHSLGVDKNFEQAVLHCQGDVIFFSDQDDVWLPSKLERMAAAFERNPGLGGVFCDAEVVDSNLQPKGFTVWQSLGFSPGLQRRVLDGKSADLFMERCIDYDGWTAVMLALLERLSLVPEVLVKYRQHPCNTSGGVVAPSSLQEIILHTVFRKDRTSRNVNLTANANRLEAVRDRLVTVENIPDWSAKTHRLDQKIKHLRRRASMPPNRLYRVPSVIREALTLRYHKCGRGTRDIIKDFLEQDFAGK